MPVTFRPPDVMELDKYGKFIAVSLPSMTIAAADAVSITAADAGGWLGSCGLDPTIRVQLPISKGWGAVIERFNFGDTSRPDKVFYEIWVDPGPLAEYVTWEREEEVEGWYFHCCGIITNANVDNRSTHPSSAAQLDLKLWNRTASPGMVAEDVTIEFAVWFYKFKLEYLEKIQAMSFANLFGNLSDKLDEVVRQYKEMNELLREAPWPRLAQIERR